MEEQITTTKTKCSSLLNNQLFFSKEESLVSIICELDQGTVVNVFLLIEELNKPEDRISSR